MSYHQHVAEFGMEYSSMDFADTSLLAKYFHLVVCGRLGLLDLKYFGGYVDHRLGYTLR